jgi:hypothetical protein
MSTEKSIIERAYELAESGSFDTVDDVSKQLIKEGFEGVHSHLSSAPTLRKQLAAMCKNAARTRQADQAISAVS